MAGPKKPVPDDDIQAEDMTYSTPKLDPKTGVPIDTRFQADTSKEVAASKQSPKSGSPAQAPQVKGKNGDEDEDEDDETSKKPRSRR